MQQHLVLHKLDVLFVPLKVRMLCSRCRSHLIYLILLLIMVIQLQLPTTVCSSQEDSLAKSC